MSHFEVTFHHGSAAIFEMKQEAKKKHDSK